MAFGIVVERDQTPCIMSFRLLDSLRASSNSPNIFQSADPWGIATRYAYCGASPSRRTPIPMLSRSACARKQRGDPLRITRCWERSCKQAPHVTAQFIESPTSGRHARGIAWHLRPVPPSPPPRSHTYPPRRSTPARATSTDHFMRHLERIPGAPQRRHARSRCRRGRAGP